jgi:hypothetical protein
MRFLTEHPATVGETYAEHLHSATGFGLRMVVAGIACLIHGLLPFLFESVGSRTVTTLHDRMVRNRRRRPTTATRGGAELAAGEGI